MKRSAPSVTSIPRAPADEHSARVRTYAITMTVRMVCFALAVLITPYSWYTWVFAVGAMILPYIAVVLANASTSDAGQTAEAPVIALEAAPPSGGETKIIEVREAKE